MNKYDKYYLLIKKWIKMCDVQRRNFVFILKKKIVFEFEFEFYTN